MKMKPGEKTAPPEILQKCRKKRKKSPHLPHLPPRRSGGDLLQPSASSTLELLLPRYEANYLSFHPCTQQSATCKPHHLQEQWGWVLLGVDAGKGFRFRLPMNALSQRVARTFGWILDLTSEGNMCSVYKIQLICFFKFLSLIFKRVSNLACHW